MPNHKDKPNKDDQNITTSHSHTSYEDHSGLVWPIFLIFVGVILLLNTTGVVSWSVWSYLWRFWPIFLILGGVSVILGKSKVAGYLVALVAFLVFLAITIMAISAVSHGAPQWFQSLGNVFNASVGNGQHEEISVTEQDYHNVTSRDVNLSVDAGVFTMIDEDSTDYFKLSADYFDNFGKPTVAPTFSDSHLEVTMDTETHPAIFSIPSDRPSYDFVIGQPNIDTNFSMTVGAGKGTVTFDKIKIGEVTTEVGAGDMSVSLMNSQLNKFTSKVGAGKMEVFLDENVENDAELDFNIGTGSAILTIPSNIGYRVHYDIGVGSIELGDETFSGLGKKDESFESDNFDSASVKLDITVKVGVGSFKLTND